MARQALARVPDDTKWFWQDFGTCRTADPELFYHPANERGLHRIRRERAAKAVCAHCPVRIECANYAFTAREPFGIWGGFSEEEREQRLATG